MKTLTVAVDEKYVKLLDRVIKNSGLYSSRSEFVKEAVRQKMLRIIELDEEVKIIRKKMRKFRERHKHAYKDRGDLTREQKDKIASDYIKTLNQ